MRSFALVLLATAGCAEVPPVVTTLGVNTLQLAAGQTLGHDPLGLAVDVITPINVRSHPEILLRLSWRERDQNAVMGGSGGPKSVERNATEPVLPLPAFALHLSNHSSGPVSFAHAKISLSDGMHSWPAFTGAAELTGRVESDLIGAHDGMQGNRQVLDSVAEVVGRVPYLSAKTTIAAGADWQGYLVFKLDAHDLSELHEWLALITQVTLRLENVELEGAPVLLEAKLEKILSPTEMMCPGGGKPAAIKICKLKE